MELIITVLGAIVLHLVGSELYSRAPKLAERLVSLAVRRLPEALRDRYREEWLAHLAECTGNLTKLLHGVECIFCARGVGRIVSARPSATYGIGINGKNLTLDAATFVFFVTFFARQMRNFAAADPDFAARNAESIAGLTAFDRQIEDLKLQDLGEPDPKKLKEIRDLILTVIKDHDGSDAELKVALPTSSSAEVSEKAAPNT